MHKFGGYYKKIFIFCLFVIFLSLISCSENVDTSLVSDVTKVKEIAKKVTVEKKDKKIVEDWEEFESIDFPLVAAIPDKDVYLYGIKGTDCGVILMVNGKGHYFDWSYLTPRFILPEMNIADYDKDGKNELAVILYVGSGSGCAVEELHILEISGSEHISDEPNSKDFYNLNPEYFKDSVYSENEYLSSLEKVSKVRVNIKAKKSNVDILLDKKRYNASLGWDESDKDLKFINEACYGNIVYFNFDGDKINAKFGLGIINDKYADPRYIGDVLAEVSYEKGKFSLSNYIFKVDD